MADEEMKQVEVLFGPYAGQLLTMPAADADQAEADHWAIPVRSPPYDASAAPAHGNLTPEEREAAELAAGVWAANVQGQPVPGAAPEAEAEEAADDETGDEESPGGRAMTPAGKPSYSTRRR